MFKKIFNVIFVISGAIASFWRFFFKKQGARFLSARIASASASISLFVRPCVRPCVPKPQFHYLHNQQLCQFMSDWSLRWPWEFWSKSLHLILWSSKNFLIEILEEFSGYLIFWSDCWSKIILEKFLNFIKIQ